MYAELSGFIESGRWNDLFSSDAPQKLGAGTFGVAMKVKLGGTCGGSPVVVKSVKLSRSFPSYVLWNELQIQNAVGLHPNLVALYDYYPRSPEDWSSEGSVYLLMPLAGGGELDRLYKSHLNSTGVSSDVIEDWGQWFGNLVTIGKEAQYAARNQMIARMAVDLFRGLSHLHGVGYVHRDLKPANIWASKRNCNASSSSCRYMIGDFGLATTAKAASQTVVGTPAFMPPEIGGSYAAGLYQTPRVGWTPKGDVWALGLTLLTLLTQQEIALSTFGSRLMSDPRGVLRNNVAGVPSKLADLLSSTLKGNPESRPSAQGAYEKAIQVYTELKGEAPPSLRIDSLPKCIRECARMNCCYGFGCKWAKGTCTVARPLSALTGTFRSLGLDWTRNHKVILPQCSKWSSIPRAPYDVGDDVVYKSSTSTFRTRVTEVARDEIMIAGRPGRWLSPDDQEKLITKG
eukprot:TRINITY_DN33614_c0_g1_i1.p1 TRINITY_DN33614_c0_g1~~TRINITY_DN33614_c0_g1_i1.p1  ORF type:complete len:516 (-),score=53.26 TRINITY_DN33614_c0_g1_i1:42-1415(-)